MGVGDLVHLVGQYGYLAVFSGEMLESAGVPLPGETVLLASGALAHEGILDPGGRPSLRHTWPRDGRADRLLGRPPLRPTLCAALGTVRLYHARALGTRRDILRPARRQSRLPGTLRCGSESLRGSGGGHKPRMPWGRFALYNVLGGTVWATA